MDCTVEITLLRDAPKKVQGVTVHSYAPTRTVWADKKSVKWGEFFAASACRFHQSFPGAVNKKEEIQ